MQSGLGVCLTFPGPSPPPDHPENPGGKSKKTFTADNKAVNYAIGLGLSSDFSLRERPCSNTNSMG